ncbi:hypothetical protein C9374_002548 [Naegleria lovaniensis]|uniref:Protein kinase domain-containing protein n=1 Tax=Naegleria lovaniensis TaxID=51637 RepID=A0AA88GSA5_NAELO|nr:uncharacterized protein C9374_002548 [Naegleria lovaniensis]KAG2386102.1 hypothetical protein C9374_002548 [Naegleria lovaniensis]
MSICKLEHASNHTTVSEILGQWKSSKFGIHNDDVKQQLAQLSISLKHDEIPISGSLQINFSKFKELLHEHEEHQYSKHTAMKILDQCGFPSSNKEEVLVARSRLIRVLRPGICCAHSTLDASELELSRTWYSPLLDLVSLFPSKFKTDGYVLSTFMKIEITLWSRNVQTNTLANISEQFEENLKQVISKMKPDRFVQFQLNPFSNQRISAPLIMIRVVEEDKTMDSSEGHEDFIKLVTELRVLHSYNVRAIFLDQKQSFHETFATYGLLVTKTCVDVIAITVDLEKDNNQDRMYYNLHHIGSFEGALEGSQRSRLELCALLLAIFKTCADEQKQIEEHLQQRKNKKSSKLKSARKSVASRSFQLVRNDEIVLSNGFGYEITGIVESCVDSSNDKQVVLVKSKTTSFFLKIFSPSLNYYDCKPSFSLYLTDAKSCTVYRNKTFHVAPNDFEVSLSGTCLSQLLTFLPVESKKRVLMDLLCEMKYIHSKNMIHNDIKLDNIVIYTDTNQVQYSKLIDFECCKMFVKYNMKDEVCYRNNEDTLFSGSGTPGYHPPEKLAIINNPNNLDLCSSLTPKSDIYSLGIVFLELLTGRYISESQEIQTALTTLSNDNDFAHLQELISSMIDPEKAKRPMASTIIETLTREKGWDTQLAQEAWKKARTPLTYDFWTTHGTLEMDVDSQPLDTGIDNTEMEQLLEVTSGLESTENKKRNHPVLDVMDTKKRKH